MVSTRGQASVEAALVMPLMVFLALGLVQLTMLQQARLLTEYATYQAARTGIVWNGNVERMHDAAVLALLPSLGRTDDFATLAQSYQKHQDLDAALKPLPWGVGRTQINGVSLTGLIRIDTVNPNLVNQSYGLWKLEGGPRWEELDFDGPEGYPETPLLERHVAKLFSLATPDPDEVAYRNATLLQIRLRYWYELKVPFANQVIFLAWYAANADVSLYGAIDRSSTQKQNMLGKSGSTSGLKGRGKGIWDPTDKGFPAVLPSEMLVLWELASGATSALAGRHYFMPLQATHSMRMQSNFYKKWLMH